MPLITTATPPPHRSLEEQSTLAEQKLEKKNKYPTFGLTAAAKIVRQSETTWNALCKSHFSDIYMAYGTRADKGRAGVEQETHGQPIHAVHSGGGRVRWDEGGGD